MGIPSQYATLAATFCTAALVACQDNATPLERLLSTLSDSATGIDSSGAVSPLTLLMPAPDAHIPQNDTMMGCEPHPYRGSGFQIHFAWTPADTLLPVAAYHLYVKKNVAQYPLVDLLLGETEFHLHLCNAFVADFNLPGWYWRVAALDSIAAPLVESETHWFAFLPCRLADGSACSAPAMPGPSATQGLGRERDRSLTGVERPSQ